MNIVYLGTPDFAVAPLKSLIEDKRYNVVAVVTNHDKPVGRKQILTPPPVKEVALKNNIPVYQYGKIRLEGVEDLKKLNADLFITCAFGQILSQEIIDIPRLGVINVHASLLPKYRGASPIHYAILNGERKTGISIMKTDAGIDTGDVIFQKEIDILDNETCGELFERLSCLGAETLIETLPSIIDGTATYTPQNDLEASYTKIIKKELAKIDWADTAKNNYNKIRAFNPAPVAYCEFEGNPFKIYTAEIVDINGKSGQILRADDKLIIACGKQALSLLRVQKAGGKPMDIKDFLRGVKLNVKKEFC